MEVVFSAYPRWYYDNGWVWDRMIGGPSHYHYVVMSDQILRRYYTVYEFTEYEEWVYQGDALSAIIADVDPSATIVAYKDSLILVRFTNGNGKEYMCPILITNDRLQYVGNN